MVKYTRKEAIVTMFKIINGDSKEAIKTLSCVENPIIVTDPPFNIGYRYNSYKDKMDKNEYIDMLYDVLTFLNCPFVVVNYPETICELSIRLGYAPKRVVSWVYNSNTARQHRDIAFFNIEPDFNRIRQPYKNPNDKRIKKLIENGKVGGRLYDWWNVNQVKNVSKYDIKHPCVMPVEVMSNIIGILPDKYTVIDPFCGSGTTGIAAVNAGCDFIGIDMDELYCELAKNRIVEASKNK